MSKSFNPIEPGLNFEPGEWIWDPSQGKYIKLGLQQSSITEPSDPLVQESAIADETGGDSGNP